MAGSAVASVIAVLHVYWIAVKCVLYELWLRLFVSRDSALRDLRDKFKLSQFVERPRNRALVTGGSGEIGTEIVRLLLDFGFEVLVLAREEPAEFRDRHGFVYYAVDLSSLNEVKRVAQRITSSYDRLDLVICNAGVMLHPYTTTVDGFEYHWGVNVLSPALLLQLVRPLLLASGNARVVAVASATGAAGRLQDCREGEFGQRYLNGYQAYADSKQALVMYIAECARRWSTSSRRHIEMCTLHPGVVPGRLYRHTMQPIQWMICGPLGGVCLRSGFAAAIDVLDRCFEKRIDSGAYYEYGSQMRSCWNPDTAERVYSSISDAISMHVHAM